MNLTTQTDLSILYKILHVLIRPFRPRLVAPGKPLPAGSPLLTPPKTKCSIHHREVAGINLYDFRCPLSPNKRKPAPASGSAVPSPKPAKRTHRILYFAGGGFQSPPSKEHWVFCSELCLRLSDLYQITLISYPLAPNSPAAKSLPLLHKWLRATCTKAVESNESLTLMGDSAGANVALSLAFWWVSHSEHEEYFKDKPGVEEDVNNDLNKKERSPLKNVFVISPPTDLRNQNSSIFDADKHDPILSIPLIESAAEAWAGLRSDSSSSWDLDRPELSPNLMDASKFQKLRDSDVKIHGVVGTHDVLAPDALMFYEKCKEYGIEGEWLKWEGQMHCFPLAWKYGLSEGKKSLEWILVVLRNSV